MRTDDFSYRLIDCEGKSHEYTMYVSGEYIVERGGTLLHPVAVQWCGSNAEALTELRKMREKMLTCYHTEALALDVAAMETRRSVEAIIKDAQDWLRKVLDEG